MENNIYTILSLSIHVHGILPHYVFFNLLQLGSLHFIPSHTSDLYLESFCLKYILHNFLWKGLMEFVKLLPHPWGTVLLSKYRIYKYTLAIILKIYILFCWEVSYRCIAAPLKEIFFSFGYRLFSLYLGLCHFTDLSGCRFLFIYIIRNSLSFLSLSTGFSSELENFQPEISLQILLLHHSLFPLFMKLWLNMLDLTLSHHTTSLQYFPLFWLSVE